MGVDGQSTIIENDLLGNAKPVDEVTTDEVGYISLGSFSEGLCINPFPVALCGI